MTLHSSIFQAYCYGHPCQVSLGQGSTARDASLVTISSRAARVQMNENAPLPSIGDLAELAPRFLDGVQIENIKARVVSISGSDLRLCFLQPLPMSGARLCQLTRR